MYICESHASHNQSALCLMCSGRPHATGSSTRYTASLPSPNRLNSEPHFGFAQLLMSGLSDIKSPASDVTKASHCDPHHSLLSRCAHKLLAAGTWMGSSIQTRFENLADNQQDEVVEVAIRFYG